jgi:hypothetical protein
MVKSICLRKAGTPANDRRNIMIPETREFQVFINVLFKPTRNHAHTINT